MPATASPPARRPPHFAFAFVESGSRPLVPDRSPASAYARASAVSESSSTTASSPSSTRRFARSSVSSARSSCSSGRASAPSACSSKSRTASRSACSSGRAPSTRATGATSPLTARAIASISPVAPAPRGPAIRQRCPLANGARRSTIRAAASPRSWDRGTRTDGRAAVRSSKRRRSRAGSDAGWPLRLSTSTRVGWRSDRRAPLAAPAIRSPRRRPSSRTRRGGT